VTIGFGMPLTDLDDVEKKIGDVGKDIFDIKSDIRKILDRLK
jgi:hypothetical protein